MPLTIALAPKERQKEKAASFDVEGASIEGRQEETESSSVEGLSTTCILIEGRKEEVVSSNVEQPSVTQTWNEGREEEIKSSNVEATTTKRTQVELSEGRPNKQQAMETADLFVRPKETEREFFFQSHPIQPFENDCLSFVAKKYFLGKMVPDVNRYPTTSQ